MSLENYLSKKDDNLFSIWKENKTKLTHALSLISESFPTFSRHDASHSDSIIKIMECILGNNIEKLGASDTFLLLMAAYTHDLGMYLPYKFLEKEWTTNDLKEKVTKLCDHKDRLISEAAKLLVNSQRAKSEDDTLLWALEVKNAVTLINTELFRGGHAQRSAEFIRNDFTEYLTESAKELAGLPFTLANIAYLHYENFSDILVPHEKEYDGFIDIADKYHPRFVACMLRLGDLLDFKHNRFNPLSLALVKEIPEIARIHYEKHCSTGGNPSIISPNRIKVTFDCKEDVVFREAAKWKSMVEQELNNIRIHWTEIVPDNIDFRLPTSEQVEIKLKFNGDENINPKLMHLRFEISSQRTFEMLKGGAIYKNPGRVFLREIVQNAMDATKLQIWADIKESFPLKAADGSRIFNSKEDFKNTAFSDDISTEIYEKYPISLKIVYDDKKQSIIVICEDYGTGISEESLIRMTSQVGASRSADKGYENNIAEMPSFLQPTAAFGLGLQTVFYVVDEFTVDTYYPNDRKTRRIVLKTSTDGSFCSIEKENFRFTRNGKEVEHGTTVTIVIDKNRWHKLFELTDDEFQQNLNNDPINYEYYFPSKIDTYIKESFLNIKNIPFHYQSPYYTFSTQSVKKEYQHLLDSRQFRVKSKRNQDKCLSFEIEENKYGSIIELTFKSELSRRSTTEKLFLRGIPLSNSLDFYGHGVVEINWDIYHRKMNQMVGISRNELLMQGESLCRDIITGLMPEIIKMTAHYIIRELNTNNSKLLWQYYHLCLIDWEYPSQNYEPLEVIKMPADWVDDINGQPINAKSLFECQRIVICNCKDVRDIFTLIPNVGEIFKSNKRTIFVKNDLIDSIPNRFVCKSIHYIENGDNDSSFPEKKGITFLVLDDHPGKEPSMVNNPDLSLEHLSMWNNQKLLYGFEQYKTIVVQDAPLLGFIPPDHGNCWIYPSKLSRLEEIPYQREDAEMYIRKKNRMEELVPDYIVHLIQKYNILGNNELTKETIYDTYIQLILDSMFGREYKTENAFRENR